MGHADVAAASHSPDLVAVFPFTFSGAGDARYLGDRHGGSAERGPGRRRPASERSPQRLYLARHITREASRLTRSRPRDWAGQLGAELYVLGDIVATGNRVLIGAAMYDNSGKDPVAQSSVEGNGGEVFELVDRLAADLIASRYGEPRERLTRVAAVTHPIAARLQGVSRRRATPTARGATPRPSRHSSSAVGTDSTFALAYYRLSDAADRAGRPDLAQSSAEAGAAFPATAGRAGAPADRGPARLAPGPGERGRAAVPEPGGRLPRRRRGLASAGRGAGTREPAPGTLLGRRLGPRCSRCSLATRATARR